MTTGGRFALTFLQMSLTQWRRDEGAESPCRRVRGRPRLPLRLHARVVAALEGPSPRRASTSSSRPYRGRSVESPWWRTRAEPALPRGRALRRRARRSPRGCKGDRYLRRRRGRARRLARRPAVRERSGATSPRAGSATSSALLERERDVDAVVVFTVPMAISAASRPRCASASTCPSSSTTATCR